MKFRRIGVTGATGFVGRHVVRELTIRGHEVVALIRSTSRVEFLNQLNISHHRAEFDEPDQLVASLRGCDALIHLAGAVDFGMDWPRFQTANVVGTHNVLSAAQRAGVRRAVHCSSIVAVGASRSPRLLDESARWSLGGVNVPYVTTKKQAEKRALMFNGRDLEVVVVNPACVIGPGDETSSEFGTLCRRFWRGRVPIHFGGGNNFVDVRDVAAGMIAALHRGRPGERYILGNVNRSMSAFFSLLALVSQESIPRWRLPSFLGSAVAVAEQRWARKRSRAYLSPMQARLLPWFFFFDCSKARNELGFAPRAFKSTLQDTFEFWQGSRAA